MPTLLMRLEGPMQSWGSTSRFSVRDTELEPTKSGVIGLICAALGKARSDVEDPALPPLSSLAALRFGVRVDRRGTLARDYQTVGGSRRKGEGGVAKADGGRPQPVITERYYLADASFVAGLEGADEALLRTLLTALRLPHWPLYLGRRAYVPSRPIGERVSDLSLEAALRTVPLASARLTLGHSQESGRQGDVWMVLETSPDASSGEIHADVPVSLEQRRFGPRYVQRLRVDPSSMEVEESA